MYDGVQMDVKGKKVLVLGAGRSGIGSATLLAHEGATVALHDKKPVAEWSEEARSLKETLNVGLIEGKIPSWLLDQIELVVISPGVPTGSIPARYVDRKDGLVIGEVELAYRFLKNRFIGITGSNGKTTTTTLVGELLKDTGISSVVAGNIGTPLVSLIGNVPEDAWVVAELSSFQLETIRDFRPRIGVCLNVTPNHMDRYELFTDYAAAKHRLFMNQESEDLAVLNADDEVTKSWVNGLRAHVSLISTRQELDEGLYLKGRDLVSRSGGAEKVLTNRDEMKLRGLHNVENVLVALAVGLACGAEPDSMRETVRRFKAVEHRLEHCGEIEGVNFYNDSKATSVDATQKALEALADEPGKLVLILGGLGKKAPYAPLEDLIRENARAMVLIGEDADTIERELGRAAKAVRAATLELAVAEASRLAEPGDTVLLAPACASFDMFRSFEERGNVFKDAVEALSASSGATDASSA